MSKFWFAVQSYLCKSAGDQSSQRPQIKVINILEWSHIGPLSKFTMKALTEKFIDPSRLSGTLGFPLSGIIILLYPCQDRKKVDKPLSIFPMKRSELTLKASPSAFQAESRNISIHANQ